MTAAHCLYDDDNEYWRTVPPSAGTLVVFRADRVLHKVAPTHAERFALTVFFFGDYES